MGISPLAISALALLLTVPAARAETFDAWRKGFEQRAAALGCDPDTAHLLIGDITLDRAIIKADKRRVAAGGLAADYVLDRVTKQRIKDARAFKRRHEALLIEVERALGVSADVIVAIWSLETDLGAAPLRYDAVTSVASLAYGGSRPELFESHLVALVRIVEGGYARRADLKSSWDGGLGQAQFMPDTFLSTAVDWNADGRRDLWRDTGDNAASIANYLRVRDWQGNGMLVEEVSLPADPDIASLVAHKRSIAEWQALGLRPAAGPDWTGAALPEMATLTFPAGVHGPALLTFANFEVLRSYNGATKYGWAAAMLVREIGGAPALQVPFERTREPLTTAEMSELQRLLLQLGFDAGEVDGQFGERTLKALRGFEASQRLAPSEAPTRALLQALRGAMRATHAK